MNLHEWNLYQRRHLFKGDEHVGKYDHPTLTAYLRPEFEGLKEECRAFFMSREGIALAGVSAGKRALPAPEPLVAFPADILALMSPVLGDRTPAVMEWAHAHLSPADLVRRYPDWADEVTDLVATPDPEKPKAVKKSPEIKKP
jgi:hypothetical protein